jgi:hypothetical protein
MKKNKVVYNTLTITFAVISCLTLFVLSPGCAPNLTVQEKREDIQFLADWAEHYSPFVEVNERIKGCPSYRDLLPKYLEYAEQAETNTEFLYVVQGYFNLICNSGHAYIEGSVGWPLPADFKAHYWKALYNKKCLAYPPFRVFAIEDEYYISDRFKRDKVVVPAGSKILTVNCMSPSSHLEYVKANSWLRYHAADTSLTERLLAVNEGEGF